MQPMKIPLLLDDLICFAIAIAFATLFSFLGAWMAHATRDQRPILPELYLSIVAWMTRTTREHRIFQVPEWRPIRNGTLVAVVILYASGVGALLWAGDYNINSGLFGALFWNKRRIDQGLIGLAWTAILVFWWVVAVYCISLVVAFMTVRLHRHDPPGVRAGQFSLRTMLIHSILFSYGI